MGAGRKRLEKTNRKKRCGEVRGRQEAYNRYVVVATSLEGVSAARIPELSRMRRETGLVMGHIEYIIKETVTNITGEFSNDNKDAGKNGR